MSQHSLQSSYREKLIEHLFVGELLKHSWLSRDCALEIARPEVDNSGYDLIAEHTTIVRHIQLKAARRDAATASQKVHINLATKQSGCVVWVYFDDATLELGPFLFFGNSPGEPLPSLDAFKNAKHAKGEATGLKKERPNIRVVPKREFTRLSGVRDTYDTLFGKA